MTLPAPRSASPRARLAQPAALLALCLLAVYPILSGGLPTVGDGLNHFYRFAELDWHVRQGDFYPRWFANLGYGFGMPVLNFYSPLSYYIPLVFRLAGLPLAVSLQLGYALALGLATLGASAWARRQFDSDAAGLLAGAAYGLAPYFYFNIFHRGAYPETWALALAPWLLWSAARLAARPADRRAGALFALLLAALVLTHTLSAVIIIPLAGLYFLGLLIVPPADAQRPGLFHILRISQAEIRIPSALLSFALHGLLALAMSAFFSLPVLFESQDIQLQRTYSTGDLDYHHNFLPPTALLAAPPDFDPARVFNVMPPSLGWPQAALAAAALLAAGVQLARRQPVSGALATLAVLGLPALALMGLTLPAAEPLWNLVPFARFIQFPWRLLGPASLLLAGLAAAAALARRWQSLLMPAGLAAAFFFSLSWSYHADFHNPPYASPADSAAYERSSGQLGTASTAEYLPRWVTQLPDPASPATDLSGAGLASRLQPLPDSITYMTSQPAVNQEALTYSAKTAFTATYNLFYFPGWAARLDDAPLALQPAPGTGLITAALPAGTHSLRLYRELTWPQMIGLLLSLAGLLILLWRWRGPAAPAGTASVEGVSLSPRLAWAWAGLCLALLGVRGVYLDRVETVFHHRNPIPNPLSVDFDGQLELIGLEAGAQVESGGALPVTLYWRAQQALSADYSVSVQLADGLGQRFGQSDSQHPDGVPTSRWSTDQYARDAHRLVSLKGTPPGDYHLLVTVYGARPLSWLRDGAPAGVDYDLGSVRVTAPTAERPGPLALVDHDLAVSSVAVGDELAFTAVWFSGDGPPPGLSARIELIGGDGATLLGADLPPAGPDYPSDRWRPDTYVRYAYHLLLPPGLPAGTARLRLSLVGAGGAPAAGPYDLGPISVSVPPRVFAIPSMQVRVDHDYAGSIRLLGYDHSPNAITLYWQSLKAITARLTVFVHRLDAAGAFVAGHDAAPARPTSGWLPGEVITDIHPISAGDHFEVGLYDPVSGDRFGEIFVTQR
jgi:hypothetical protein